MHTLIVIPARVSSVRIPEKPLCLLHGEPLLRVTIRRVLSFGLDSEVVVATDDEQVARVASDVGVRAFQTSPNHACGTERVAEVANRPEFTAVRRVLNVQCDQPMLPREAAVGALECIDDKFQIGTSAAPLAKHHESDRNRVKVAVGKDRTARLFSRKMPDMSTLLDIFGVYLHLGVYAYTREALLEWTARPSTEAEIAQGLEQLRPFLAGTPIGVALLEAQVEPGIDTFRDLAHARKSLDLTRMKT